MRIDERLWGGLPPPAEICQVQNRDNIDRPQLLDQPLPTTPDLFAGFVLEGLTGVGGVGPRGERRLRREILSSLFVDRLQEGLHIGVFLFFGQGGVQQPPRVPVGMSQAAEEFEALADDIRLHDGL